MARHKTTCDIKHNGRFYKAGSWIQDLTEEQAAHLLSTGSLEAPAAAKGAKSEGVEEK